MRTHGLANFQHESSVSSATFYYAPRQMLSPTRLRVQT